MATSLLTQSQINSLVAVAERHMPTFWEPIVIHKEPTQTVVSNLVNSYPGYKSSSVETNITYSPVNQTFSGLVVKMSNKTPQELYEVNKRIWKGDARIKVEQSARDYILNGKTIKITTDAGTKSWDVIGGPSIQAFLNLYYYYFDLKEIH